MKYSKHSNMASSERLFLQVQRALKAFTSVQEFKVDFMFSEAPVEGSVVVIGSLGGLEHFKWL